MTKYEIIFESLQEKVNSGELSLEDASVINDIAYEKYICEMKTKAEYGERSFKKKYDFIPDKPGARTGTILVDGKRQRVDFDKTKDIDATALDGTEKGKIIRQTKSDIIDDDSTITLDNHFFRLKGSNKNQRRDAILQHEVGHTRLHPLSANSSTLDKSKSTPLAHKQSLDAAIKSFGIDPDEFLDKETRKDLNRATGSEQYKKMSLRNSSKEARTERNKGIKAASKYVKKDNPHSSTIEIEADRYAANRTSPSALKRGVREYAKKVIPANTTKKSLAYQLGVENPDILPDEYLKDMQSKIKGDSEKDLRLRTKALKDKDLINNKTYKK